MKVRELIMQISHYSLAPSFHCEALNLLVSFTRNYSSYAMPITQIASGSFQVFRQVEKLSDFLARLLPRIDEEYRWTIAAEIFLWNHCCEHISAQSLCFSFQWVYKIDIDKREIPEILEKINFLSRTFPRDVRNFKDLAFEWHSHWAPENSKFKDVYKTWSRLQDQMEEERCEESVRNEPRASRYTTPRKTEYHDADRDPPSRERFRHENVYYREEPRRGPIQKPQRAERRPSYDVITREPGTSSRSTRSRHIRQPERRPAARSTSYSDDSEDSQPRVIVVEPRRRR